MREPVKKDYWLLVDEELEPERAMHKVRKSRTKRKKRAEFDAWARTMLVDELNKEEDQFKTTYKAARHEQVWLSQALAPFFHDSLISDVLRLARGGKEANVYCCQAHPAIGQGLLAAKVYRPQNRVMKNDALYREGRMFLGDDGKVLLHHREARAIQKKTRKGKEFATASWIEHEFQTMQVLYHAGADIPQPIAQIGDAILMEYIGDISNPAPILHTVTLEKEEALGLFEVLMRNVELMLGHHRVHADLSAYNVLYWDGKVKIIDFPQVVDPLLNPSGYILLARDIYRICQFFNRCGVQANAGRIATDLWGRYLRGELRRDKSVV